MNKKTLKILIAIAGPIALLLIVLHLTWSGVQSHQAQGIGGPVPLPDRLIPLNGDPNPAWRVLNTTGDLQAQADDMWVGRSEYTSSISFNSTGLGIITQTVDNGGVIIDSEYGSGLLFGILPVDYYGVDVIGGYELNSVAPGSGGGNTIFGGGVGYLLGSPIDGSNQITSSMFYDPAFGLIVPGGNFVAGVDNTISSTACAIPGGYGNLIDSTGVAHYVVGYNNEVTSSGVGNTIGGGGNNTISGIGSANTINGGFFNEITSDGTGYWDGDQNVINGGSYNVISNSFGSGIGAGSEHLITGITLANEQVFIGAGDNVTVTDCNDCFVGAADTTTATGAGVFIGSGNNINVDGTNSGAGTGAGIDVDGNYSFATGANCDITGDYSFAAGRAAKVNHDGTFIWADSSSVSFSSDRDDQVKFRASGGVFLNQDSTVAARSVLELDQDDINESFINYIGTSTADQLSSISTVNGDGTVDGPRNASAAAGWTFEGMVRIEINGVEYWMPFYSVDTP